MYRSLEYSLYVIAVLMVPIWAVNKMSGSQPSTPMDENECQIVMTQPGTSYAWEEIQADKMETKDPVGARLRRIYNRIDSGRVDEAFIQMSSLHAMDPAKTYRKRSFSADIGAAFIRIYHDDDAKKWFADLEEDPDAVVARIVHARYLLESQQDAVLALRLTREVYTKPHGLLSVSDYLLYASVLKWNNEQAEAERIIKEGIVRFYGTCGETERLSLTDLAQQISIE